MPLYMIERAFADQLELTDDDVKVIEEINADEGVRWLFSFLSADRRRTYCLYEAPSPDAIVQPSFQVQSALTALQAGRLAREAQTVIELVRDREFVSREDAMGSAARAAGGFSPDQYRAYAATVEDRRVFFRTYVPALPADSRALFGGFSRSPEYAALVSADPPNASNPIFATRCRSAPSAFATRAAASSSILCRCP